MLLGWLDWQHQTVHLKCEALAEAEAYRAPLPTSPRMSVVGVVSHLVRVERDWLEVGFLGDHSRATTNADGGWDAGGRPLDELLESYRLQCRRSQQILADHRLDELEAWAPPGHEPVSLRWIATHLIEETGRHLGHLDLLREMAHGSRGE